jgi:hypothetical protein
MAISGFLGVPNSKRVHFDQKIVRVGGGVQGFFLRDFVFIEQPNDVLVERVHPVIGPLLDGPVDFVGFFFH